jgi:exonuclease VII small subunit
MLKTTLNKNIIYVFHSVESTDKDGNPVQRLMCEGANKNTVWTPCDFGGYVQMIGENRVICFTPEQEFFAKGCHGINGKYTIPALGPDDSNDFLTKLFDQAKENITEENNAFAPVRAQYEAVMEEVRAILEAITTAEEATEAAMEIPTMEHALTSKKECSALLNARAKQLGLRWNKTAGRYEKAGA